MDPIAIITTASAALSLVEQLLPLIDGLQKNGQISVADQAALLAKYESLKAKADGQFSGPAWQVT